jgi:hypothetical protein
MDKIITFRKKLKNIEELKSIYCYNREKLETDYCIALSYQEWLTKITYTDLIKNKLN